MSDEKSPLDFDLPDVGLSIDDLLNMIPEDETPDIDAIMPQVDKPISDEEFGEVIRKVNDGHTQNTILQAVIELRKRGNGADSVKARFAALSGMAKDQETRDKQVAKICTDAKNLHRRQTLMAEIGIKDDSLIKDGTIAAFLQGKFNVGTKEKPRDVLAQLNFSGWNDLMVRSAHFENSVKSKRDGLAKLSKTVNDLCQVYAKANGVNMSDAKHEELVEKIQAKYAFDEAEQAELTAINTKRKEIQAFARSVIDRVNAKHKAVFTASRGRGAVSVVNYGMFNLDMFK